MEHLVLPIDDLGDRKLLAGTVGWTVPSSASGNDTKVIFSIWKNPSALNNPSSGELIFSTKDTADIDESPTSSFHHVDKRAIDISGQQRVVYVLTVHIALGSGGNNARVIGPVTFLAGEVERNRHHRHRSQ